MTQRNSDVNNQSNESVDISSVDSYIAYILPIIKKTQMDNPLKMSSRKEWAKQMRLAKNAGLDDNALRAMNREYFLRKPKELITQLNYYHKTQQLAEDRRGAIMKLAKELGLPLMKDTKKTEMLSQPSCHNSKTKTTKKKVKDNESRVKKFEKFWRERDRVFYRETFQGLTQVRTRRGDLVHNNINDVFEELRGEACDRIYDKDSKTFATTESSFKNYVMRCALENKFNILKDYVKELETAKPVELEGNVFTDFFDVPYDLVNEIGVSKEDYDNYLDEGAYVSLIACYRRWSMHGCGDEYLPILWSEEGGCGKSSFISNLVPHADLFYPNLTGSMLANQDQTELLRHLHKIAVAEMNELNFVKKDKEVIKANITSKLFRGRMLYQNAANYQRTDKVWGSSNLPQMLAADSSGYRRFMIFVLKKKWHKKMNHTELDKMMKERIRQRLTNAIYRYKHELKDGKPVYMFDSCSSHESVQNKIADHFVYRDDDKLSNLASYVESYCKTKEVKMFSISEFKDYYKRDLDWRTREMLKTKMSSVEWKMVLQSLGFTKKIRVENKRYWLRDALPIDATH